MHGWSTWHQFRDERKKRYGDYFFDEGLFLRFLVKSGNPKLAREIEKQIESLKKTDKSYNEVSKFAFSLKYRVRPLGEVIEIEVQYDWTAAAGTGVLSIPKATKKQKFVSLIDFLK